MRIGTKGNQIITVERKIVPFWDITIGEKGSLHYGMM